MYTVRTRTQQISIQTNTIQFVSHPMHDSRAHSPGYVRALHYTRIHHEAGRARREKSCPAHAPPLRHSRPSAPSSHSQHGRDCLSQDTNPLSCSPPQTQGERRLLLLSGVWDSVEWKNRFPAGCTCVRAIEIERDANEWRMHWPARRQTYQAHLFWSQRDLSPGSPPLQCGRFDAMSGGQNRAYGVN